MSLGPRLAKLREDAGLTQSALARKVRTSQSAISQIEAGERNPSYGMIQQLAEALGVTPAYLVGADVETLTPEEEYHFRQYRSLPEEARRELEQFAAYLRSRYTPDELRAARRRGEDEPNKAGSPSTGSASALSGGTSQKPRKRGR